MTQLSGIVIHGDHRGKKLGFPTANVALSEKIPEGIYISQTKIDTLLYSSLTFIGAAKTFDKTQYQAETYILDFDQDIYGKTITVELIKKIRDNMKFESEEKLIEQMKKDEKVARDHFFS